VKNISVMCNGTLYYWSNVSAKDMSLDVNFAVNYIKTTALDITDGHLEKVSSLATDTCSTQRLA
jgi:hypothetical protein